MAPAKANHPALTRESILEAAIRLFQQHGFSGLGMRQIADQLQIKAPSLYHHFASKEDMARQAMRQYREEQASRLLAIADAGHLTPAAQLQQYAGLFAGMLEDGKRPCMYLMLVREPSFQERACVDELRLFAQQNIDWLEQVLRQEEGGPASSKAMPARELAEMIFAALEGIMAVSLVDPNPAAAFMQRANKFLAFALTGE
ncbi:TetR/AcrR family transcriptional regulator [Pseudoduganella violaceinigra]|uniref:TetR/AcrR family transcriptional regulator n=1 Tax=Pseudoduganella violaceinigra TaxID=246602 RepID=UPI0003FD25C3|nr:TetR/AcrR family transcriptional regulator [Pseudoduganella violaceinigra]